MNNFKLNLLFIFTLSLFFISCNKDGTYKCYLIQKRWNYEVDTLGSYDESVWFWNRKSKPEDECKVSQADMIISHQYELDEYSFECDCGWEVY